MTCSACKPNGRCRFDPEIPACVKLQERLRDKTDMRADSECWPWTGTVDRRRGTTYLRLCFGRVASGALRAVWVVHNGPIPGLFHVVSACGNVLCCNPRHLRLMPRIAERDRVKPPSKRRVAPDMDSPEFRAAFWARTAPRANGCIEWTGFTNAGGYGLVNVKGKSYNAQRCAWIMTHGDVPKHVYICHHCDNRLCVNLEHLYAGSHQDNMRDRQARGRTARFFGADSQFAKIDAQIAHNIRADFKSARCTRVELATKYRLSLGHIHKILRLEVWAPCSVCSGECMLRVEPRKAVMPEVRNA